MLLLAVVGVGGVIWTLLCGWAAVETIEKYRPHLWLVTRVSATFWLAGLLSGFMTAIVALVAGVV